MHGQFSETTSFHSHRPILIRSLVMNTVQLLIVVALLALSYTQHVRPLPLPLAEVTASPHSAETDGSITSEPQNKTNISDQIVEGAVNESFGDPNITLPRLPRSSSMCEYFNDHALNIRFNCSSDHPVLPNARPSVFLGLFALLDYSKSLYERSPPVSIQPVQALHAECMEHAKPIPNYNCVYIV